MHVRCLNFKTNHVVFWERCHVPVGISFRPVKKHIYKDHKNCIINHLNIGEFHTATGFVG